MFCREFINMNEKPKIIKPLNIKNKWGTWCQAESKGMRFPTTYEAVKANKGWSEIKTKK